MAEKVDAIGHRVQLATFVQLQAEALGEEGFDLPLPVRQLRLVRRQQHQVIAVSQVIARLELMFNELVQRIQIDVGEELAGQVADGQAAAGLGLEQGLVGRQALEVGGHPPCCLMPRRNGTPMRSPCRLYVHWWYGHMNSVAWPR